MNRYLLVSLLTLVCVFSSVDARTLLVGPARSYKTPCDASGALQDGDTVMIDTGTYLDQACIWAASNTVIRGVSEFAHLKPPAVIPNGKAVLVISGNNTTVENIEFSNATVPDQNGAGIRQEGSNVTIRHCYFHDNEDGILGGSGNVVIEYSEFYHNGFGDGYSHNMYISACDTFTLRFSFTHASNEGHTIKSRAFRNYILYNRIASEDDSTSYEINLPNAGTSFIIGNVIEQGPKSNNSAILDYGSEGLSGHDTALYVVDNTFVNDKHSGTFISISNTQNKPKVCNNLFVGGGTVCNRQMDSAANIVTNAPAFVDSAHYNYHLTALSPGIDKGADPGSVAGFSLTPVSQYVYNCSGEPRTVIGSAIDVGAFEYGSSGTLNRVPVYSAQRNGKFYRIGTDPKFDVLGRSLPEVKIAGQGAAEKIGVVEVKK
ncbi:MAG TPA: right-handed parallel beta-helix repeat-containing protein [Chitinivibrionales bacterium]|nr:right-handed parallel beta-helix repeat-containing protein [Chitinivibrionales bacterium]